MKLTLIVLALLLLTLTACNDPLGYVQAEQIRANASVQTAQIQADVDRDTAATRTTGAIAMAVVAVVGVVMVTGIFALTHLQAQRDRLIAQGYTLPPQPTRTALGRPPSRRPTLRRQDPDVYTTLALPERSERDSTVIVIDA